MGVNIYCWVSLRSTQPTDQAIASNVAIAEDLAHHLLELDRQQEEDFLKA
jgi:hypothetical protein